jgi:hypothetical protein
VVHQQGVVLRQAVLCRRRRLGPAAAALCVRLRWAPVRTLAELLPIPHVQVRPHPWFDSALVVHCLLYARQCMTELQNV